MATLKMSQDPGNRGQRDDVSREAARRRRRQRTYAALRRRARKASDGQSALIEEPIDSGLWPTSGLSDRQIQILTEMFKTTRKP
jgi:hypothetical protein